jgi:hypothetical protein
VSGISSEGVRSVADMAPSLCARPGATPTGQRVGHVPGSAPVTIGTRTSDPHSVHEPS